MIGVRKVDRRPLTLRERFYLVEVVKGLGITLRHLVGNLVGFATGRPRVPTIAWPEHQEPAPARLRGRHRLMQRPDGTPKCVACMCCPTICPAQCIHIVAEESPDPTIEKRPASFEIDYMRCVFCGLCIEVCPVDAIRMDTGEVPLADDSREAFVFDLARLLKSRPGDPPPPGRVATGGLAPPREPPAPPTGPYEPSVFLDRRRAEEKAAAGH